MSKNNNWRVSLFVALSVFMLFFLVQTFLTHFFFERRFKEIITEAALSENDITDFVDEINKIIKDEQLKIPRNKLQKYEREPVVEIFDMPKKTYLHTESLILFFDSDNNLAKIRLINYPDIRENNRIYYESTIKNIFEIEKEVLGFNSGGIPMLQGVILIILIIIGMIFYLRFEIQTKSIKHIWISHNIFISVLVISFIMLLFRFLLHSYSLEDSIRRNYDYFVILGGLRFWMILPFYLLNIVFIDTLLLIYVNIRIRNKIKNTV